MTFFNRTTTTDHNLMTMARRAYEAAGIPFSLDRADETYRAVTQAPDVTQVTTDIAAEIFTTDKDPEAFRKAALKRVQDAMVAVELRDGVRSASATRSASRAKVIRAQALDDLAPAFTKAVDNLTDAATDLPTGNPLDPEQNIAAGTTEQMKTVRDALHILGLISSLYGALVTGGNTPPKVRDVLPLLAMPHAEIEKRSGLNDGDEKPSNADELAGAYTIRALFQELKDDPDKALIQVARGDYPGITFSMADSRREAFQRLDNTNRSFTVRSASTMRGSMTV